MKRQRFCAFLILGLMCNALTAAAEMPSRFWYEGYYEEDGSPHTGIARYSFKLFERTSDGGKVVTYAESPSVMLINNGYFSIIPGQHPVFGSLEDALDGTDVHVWIDIDTHGSPFEHIEPLIPVSYALRAAGVTPNSITLDMLSDEVDAYYVRADGDAVDGDLTVGENILLRADDGIVEALGIQAGEAFLDGANNSLRVEHLVGSTNGVTRINLKKKIMYGNWLLEGAGRVHTPPNRTPRNYAFGVRNLSTNPSTTRGLIVTTPKSDHKHGIAFHVLTKTSPERLASRLVVGAEGNVGIHINDPQYPLHVGGNARISGHLLMPQGSRIGPTPIEGRWPRWGTAGNWGPDAQLNHLQARNLSVSEEAYFKQPVGIGASPRPAMLNVLMRNDYLDERYIARFWSLAVGAKGRGLWIDFPRNDHPDSILLHARSKNKSRMVVRGDGKVGIGTPYPKATLHVKGDARFDQVVRIKPRGNLSMGIYTNEPVTTSLD